MEKKKNDKKIAKILIVIATILILTGILLAMFIKNNEKNDNKPDDKEEVYYATFIIDGEKYVNDKSIIDGYIENWPPTPTKEGYIFDYWEIDGEKYTGKEKFTSNVTLTAVFREKQKFTVTFIKDNGEKNVIKEIYEGDKVNKISDPKKEENKFLGWYYEETDILYSFEQPIEKDITLIAKWEPFVYIVTFDTNGGSKVNSKVVDYNNKVKLPTTPTKKGYKFIEWTLDGKKYDFNTKITKDITLVAKWQIITYTVTFDTNGGSSIDNQKVDYNKNVTKPENPTQNGYKFIEWTLDGKTYDFNNKITKNITLVAKWEKVEEKIAYGDIDGDGIIKPIDSLKLLKYLDLNENISDQAKKNADVNEDGKINHVDCLLILASASGWYNQPLPNSPIKDYTAYGDLNEDGLLTNDDYNKLSSYLSNDTKISIQAKKNADVNGDEVINKIDLKILKFKLNQISQNNSSKLASLSPIKEYVDYGDVNEDGKIDLADLIVLLKYLESNVTFSEQAKKNADVNIDKKINMVDLYLIMRYLSGHYDSIETLPEFPITNYVMYGDLTEDGIVDDKDSLKLQQYLNKEITLNAQATKNADVNADGNINDTDYNLLTKYISEHADGKISQEPLS